MSLRLYAPPDEQTYVLVAAAGEAKHCLVIKRGDGAAHQVPVADLDRLVGKVGARAKSCAVAAVVGIVEFPDDRSLVIVTEGNQRAIATDRGAAALSVVMKTAFLPLKPQQRWSPQQAGESESPEAALGGKQRFNLKEFLEAGDFFFSTSMPITLTLQRCAALRQSGANPLAFSSVDTRFLWNQAALQSLSDAGDGPWLTPIMQGAVLSEQLFVPAIGARPAAVPTVVASSPGASRPAAQ